MAVYTYSISNDFPNQVVSIRRLRSEIIAAGGEGLLEHIHVDEASDTCYIVTPITLSGPQKTALDDVIASHTGNPYSVEIVYGSNKVIDELLSITETTNWQELGGVVVNPTTIVPVKRLPLVVIRLEGAIRTQGTEVQFLIAEDLNGSGDIQTLISPPFSAPNTANNWILGSIDTNVNLRQGNNIYTVAARLRGSTSAVIRYAKLTVLEKRDFR
jgi:hypothetical protein